MELRAIAFNHDPTSSRRSALNVRRNAAGFVTVPEWQAGQIEPSRAAYSIASTAGQVITIRASVGSLEHAGRSAEVRARPTPVPFHLTNQWVGTWPTTPTAADVWELHAGALGRVQARSVDFGPDGESDLVDFELPAPRLLSSGAGVYYVSWTWETRDAFGRTWQPFAVTNHRVYALLDVPSAPWVQQPYDSSNTQLPWTDVLDLACTWAAGARNPTAASAAITFGVNALGPRFFAYSCAFGASANYSFLAFDCSSFLERVNGGPGNGPNVNCSDCATIVSTFANAVGCDLWQAQMFDMLQPFSVNRLRLIGDLYFRAVCGASVFNYHEVAWENDCDVDDRLYDACLAGVDPATWQVTVPAGMKFGSVGQATYRQLLATQHAQYLCRPQPHTRQRRFVM